MTRPAGPRRRPGSRTEDGPEPAATAGTMLRAHPRGRLDGRAGGRAGPGRASAHGPRTSVSDLARLAPAAPVRRLRGARHVALPPLPGGHPAAPGAAVRAVRSRARVRRRRVRLPAPPAGAVATPLRRPLRGAAGAGDPP